MNPLSKRFVNFVLSAAAAFLLHVQAGGTENTPTGPDSTAGCTKNSTLLTWAVIGFKF